MKLERKIIGRHESRITSLLEPRLEFGLLLLVICAAIIGLVVKRMVSMRNWRFWRSSWRQQESFEMRGRNAATEEGESNERRESRERERGKEEGKRRTLRCE